MRPTRFQRFGNARSFPHTAIPLSRYLALPAFDNDDGSAGDGKGDKSPDAEGAGTPPGADDGTGNASGQGTTSDASGGDQADDAGQQGTGADPVRDAKLKKLSDENAAVRLRAKAAEEQLAKLTDQTEQVATLTAEVAKLKVQLAWQRFALPAVNDLDAAAKLANLDAIKLDADGNVTGAEETVKALLQAYPWLAKVEDVDTQVFTPGSGGTPANGRREGQGAATDRATLAKKYPALKGRI